MKQVNLIAVLLATGVGRLLADPSPEDENAGLDIAHNHATNEVHVDWWAKEGFYFFLKETTDLVDDPWAYFPYAILGADAVEGVAVGASTDKMFFRLEYTDDENSSLLTADFDDDGISNGDELRRFLNVYDNSDLDGDSLPDDWEQFFGAFSASADNDGDGFTNAEEEASGENPNAINSKIAPPSLKVFGNYVMKSGVYEIADQSELSICLRTPARGAKTYYYVTAPHLEPYLRFDGTSTRAERLNTFSEPEAIDPEAKQAPILRVDNGRYTITAKSYLEHNGQTIESDAAEWEVAVRPFRTTSSQPSGVSYESAQAYYDPETGLYTDLSSNVPQQRRRFTASGWLVDKVEGFGSRFYRGFIPDLSRSSSRVYTAYGADRSFTKSSSTFYWLSGTNIIDYGNGWAAGASFCVDYSKSVSKKTYYGDSKRGWISDSRFDVDDAFEENLGSGWVCADGFVPDQSSSSGQDDVYFDNERGRLTFSEPQGVDIDEDLGRGWIGGWVDRFVSDDHGKDTDRDLVDDATEIAFGLTIENFTNRGPKDSDQDGTLDYQEVDQGSDPSNDQDDFASAGSFDATEASIIPVVFTVGDHSGSHSEEWELEIYNVASTGSEQLQTTVRAGLGALASRQIEFAEGFRQRLALDHIRGEGDYDYTFTIELANQIVGSSGVVIEDDSDLTGVKDNVSANSLDGDVFITVPKTVLKTETGVQLYLNLNAAVRTPVYFEAAPLVGPGSFKLTQGSDKIRVWTAETGGVEITGPGNRTQTWSLASSQLGSLNQANRIWVESLAASEALADASLILEYLDEDGNVLKASDEIEVTVFEMDLEFVEPQPFFENGSVAFVGNDFYGRFPLPSDRENSVTLDLVMDENLKQSLLNGLTFEVRMAEGYDEVTDKGTIDTTDFMASNGSDPIVYLTPDEEPEDHCDTLEILSPDRYFEVVAKYNRIELATSDRIWVNSRFKYIVKYSEPENQRFTRPIALVGAKYDVPDNTPQYDEDLVGAYGIVRWHPIFHPFLKIELGPAAYESENLLASTWIHENVHLNQGRSVITAINQGRELHEQHVAAGTDLSTISQADKDSIGEWIDGESEAYSAEQDNYQETCLNASERSEVDMQLSDFGDILNAMYP